MLNAPVKNSHGDSNFTAALHIPDTTRSPPMTSDTSPPHPPLFPQNQGHSRERPLNTASHTSSWSIDPDNDPPFGDTVKVYVDSTIDVPKIMRRLYGSYVKIYSAWTLKTKRIP